MKILSNFLLALVALGLMFFILTIPGGCGSQKHIRNQTSEVDSSEVQKLRIERDTWMAEALDYKRQLEEWSYLNTESDKDCPPAIDRLIESIRLVCPPNVMDSVQKLVNSLRVKIKYYSDGSSELEGALTKINIGKHRLEQENLRYQSLLKQRDLQIDSLSKELRKKDMVKSVDKERAGLFPPWAGAFGLLCVAFIIGAYFYTNKKRKS